MDEFAKINGFTRTKHPFQIFTWVYFLQLIVCYSLAVLPNFTSLLVQVIAAIVFFVLTILLVYYAFTSTNIDPTDPLVSEERRKKKLCEFIEIKEYFCSQCDTHVSAKSKHCRVCDRCVVNFDHHCKWLNNCIGQHNYQSFFRLIIAVDLQASSFIIFSLLATNYYRPLHIWVWINDLVVAILFFLNFNLTLFHIYLQSQDLTTYEYIIKNRQETTKPTNIISCHCFKTNSRASVQPDQNEGQLQLQSQPSSHRVIDVQQHHYLSSKALSNHGICNEIDVQKTQIIEEMLKKDVTSKKKTETDNEFSASPGDLQQRQSKSKKKTSQKLLIDQGENHQQFEQKPRSESNTVNDEEQEVEAFEAQFPSHEKKNTVEG